MNFNETVDYVDLEKFMGKWYVIAARATFLESGAHNSVEMYSWSPDKDHINISFTYNKDSFDGKVKSIPQKAWVHDRDSNAHWHVQPFWPIKLDYLVIDMADDYSWVVVGVPSQRYVWIMSRGSKIQDTTYNNIIGRIDKLKYSTEDIELVPQKW